MKTFSKTDIGMVREVNQDYVFVTEAPIGNLPNLLVVADGMGGHRAGEYASRLAVEVLKQELVASTEVSPEAMMKNAITRANERVLEAARQDAKLSGMGTTLVAATVIDRTLYFANVGDSRGYHITNGGISQITKDHSAVQELVDSGHITERQAKIHPNKNIITRAIGIEDEVEFDLFEVPVSQGDIIILCSDGLTNHVDENEIQFEASGGDFNDLAKRLIELANSRGGTDNVTVVAIQI